jgi:predicted phosphoribosyltransferase
MASPARLPASYLFENRRDAGRRLADELAEYARDPKGVVLALPRGGVPVAYEVAAALSLPLDVFLVRKLGVPGHEEYAFGALASGDLRVLNEDVVRMLELDARTIETVAQRESRTLHERERRYRDGRPPVDVSGKRVILVDDGLATGASMRAAIAALRQRDPLAIIAAVPVGAPDSCARVAAEVDRMVCAVTPDPLHAVSLSYRDFSETPDAEVQEIMARAVTG